MTPIARIALATIVLFIAACEQKPDAGPTKSHSVGGAPAAADHANKSDHDHDHAAPSSAPAPVAGHGGEIIDLGTTRIGDLTVRAARDKVELRPGGDAPVDVWLTTADGGPATAIAVRFWIGAEDAKGAIKARAEIEDLKEPNHWHTHTGIPDPLPEGSRLWVEVEATSGVALGSFPLK